MRRLLGTSKRPLPGAKVFKRLGQGVPKDEYVEEDRRERVGN